MASLQQLFMRRPTLDDLPAMPEPPPGYAVRLLRPGEEEGLAAVLAKVFGPEWTVEKARAELVDAPDVAATYVVTWEDAPVATASARLLPDRFPGSGYLHWVAGDPAHRGKGLGRLVTLRVLHHFRAAGCRDSVLETDDERLPALRIYLDLDYIPEYTDPTHPERWDRILRRLKINHGRDNGH
jgi:mycothiol synthase